MNQSETFKKAKEKLEYYSKLSKINKIIRVRVSKKDGLVKRFLNSVSKGES